MAEREAVRGRVSPCPECGREFTPRGLAGHRRMAHGAAKSAPEPRAAEPERSAADVCLSADVLAALLVGALGPILERLEGLAVRVEGSLLAAPSAPCAAPTCPTNDAPPGSHLSGELEGVLDAIRREKAELSALEAHWGGTPRTAEELACRESAWRRIGHLRRRQASLIFRIEDLAPGSQPGALDSGVGTV